MEELLISLQQENVSLKSKNEKLYRQNKNQQRSMLRLKNIIEKQNGFLKKIKENNIEDQDWEDLDDIVKEYEKSE
jgi:hypothetical protein